MQNKRVILSVVIVLGLVLVSCSRGIQNKPVESSEAFSSVTQSETLAVSNDTVETALTSEVGADDVYTSDELGAMAIDYYARHNDGYSPSSFDCTINDNNTVTIHLYDNMEDHIATCAWYTVDVNTAKGIDEIFCNDIDLNN